MADWGAREILAVDREGEREVIVMVDFPSFPLCFDWLPTGHFLLVSSREGRLRMESGGELVTHADLSGLAKSGHPWNEILIDGRGNAISTTRALTFPAASSLPGRSLCSHLMELLARWPMTSLSRARMAVTPDNSTLIVAESYGHRLTAFDIDADGSLSHRRVWAETGNDHPDGTCLDDQGALRYADVGNKQCVRVRERGEVLQTIAMDRGCFACMLGGADGKTLFLVATEWKGTEQMAHGSRTGQILTIRAPAPHAGWP